MKKLIILFLVVIGSISAKAQEECGTKITKPPVRFSQKQKDSLNVVLAVTTPYAVRVHITVFADDNGTNVGATDADVMRQFQNMVNQYQPRSICFILIDVRQVNNTDLNSHDADTEEAELVPYRIAGCLNIFIHNSLPGLNGTAYAIPNTYLSLSGATIASTTNLTTMGHEAGHCFGLYHTFESGLGRENVTRNSASACYDCEVDGDLLCDTPADDPADPNGQVNSLCTYTGGRTDDCGVVYAPLTNNVMTYGNRACRNAFTAGQGTRMRSMMITSGTLIPIVADNIVFAPVLNVTFTYSSGVGQDSARDELYISNNTTDNYNVTGSAVRHLQSKKVYLKPGTHFYPTTGRVHVKINPYCN
jgi:hypothetical protein